MSGADGPALPRRDAADPPADGAIREALGDGPAGTAMRSAIATLRQLEPTEPWMRAWVDEPSALPAWAEPALIERGQQFFVAWDLDIVTALFCASLPFAYAAADGVEVLARVSQLAERAYAARRIAETGRWLVAVASPGGLEPGAAGYARTREVRLLHAAIRADLDGWDAARLGSPINQQDLLGTLLSFTTVVFESLDRLGVAVADADRRAYLHLWAVIGHLLGIDDAARIADPAEAERLSAALAARLHAPSAAGRQLMAVLLAEMELSMPLGMRMLPRALVRHLIGDEVADMLAVPPAARWTLVLRAVDRASRVADATSAGRALLRLPSRLVGRSMIRMWIDRTLAGVQAPPFELDHALLARWRVRAPSSQAGASTASRIRQRARRARHSRRLGQASPPVNGR